MRARNIKPDFFLNEIVAEVSVHERLLFIGLWCLADREGRLEDRPKRIRAALYPYDDCDVDSMLDRLHQAGLAIRYQVEGENYIAIPSFSKHQQPHYKEPASAIPPPPEGPSTIPAPPRIDRSLIHDQPMIDPSLIHDQPMIDQSLIHDRPMIDRSLTDDRSKRMLDDPLNPDSLIPDSLTPDFLTPDSLSAIRLLTSAAKPATEDLRLDGFHSSKQTKNQESQTMNPTTHIKNCETQTNRPEPSNPCLSPPNEDAIKEEQDHETYSPEFEQFWEQYPMQTEKKRAFRLWQNRIRDQVDARDLIQAAKHYAAFCHRRRTDPYYIKEPTTFLGPLKVYKDWIEPTQKGRGNGDDR